MIVENNDSIFWLSLSEASMVQSLIFSKDSFSADSAKKWAASHGFKSSSIDSKESTIRLRQKNPKQFKKFRTKEFGKGIKAVLGF